MAAFRAQKTFVEKVGIDYYRFGQGQPIFLLPGWGASKEKMVPLGQAFAQKGWEAILIDWPGFGKSDFPPRPWQVDDYRQCLVKIIQDWFPQKPVYLFGHSFGGRVALKTAAKNQKKIKGLILCGSAGLSRAGFLKRFLFNTLAKTGKFFLGRNKMARRFLYRLAGEHDYEKTQGVLRETFKMVVAEDLKPFLKKIKIPVLILWGKRDKFTSVRNARLLKKTLPQAKLILFANQGHLVPYRMPEKIVSEVNAWCQ